MEPLILPPMPGAGDRPSGTGRTLDAQLEPLTRDRALVVAAPRGMAAWIGSCARSTLRTLTTAPRSRRDRQMEALTREIAALRQMIERMSAARPGRR